jgi:hypothetical protein
MYVWIWRHLPGGLPGKIVGSLVLFVGVVALLFFFVFPWVEPRLPFNHSTVDQHSTPRPAATSTAQP